MQHFNHDRPPTDNNGFVSGLVFSVLASPLPVLNATTSVLARAVYVALRESPPVMAEPSGSQFAVGMTTVSTEMEGMICLEATCRLDSSHTF